MLLTNLLVVSAFALVMTGIAFLGHVRATEFQWRAARVRAARTAPEKRTLFLDRAA